MNGHHPLYSRTGNTSPTVGETGGQNIAAIGPRLGTTITPSGQVGTSNVYAENVSKSRSSSLLLDKAQQFSMFAVNHVEEVRQALLSTAPDSTNSTSNNNFGSGKNGAEIALAFDELAAVYDKLSSLKWNAARVEFEENHRIQSGILQASTAAGEKVVEKQVKILNSNETKQDANAGKKKNPRGGVKDHPWQDDDEDNGEGNDNNGMDPHDWISDAFLKAAISDEDDLIVDNNDDEAGGDSFPVNNGHLASLNATAKLYSATAASLSTTTPPGFQSEHRDQNEVSELCHGGASGLEEELAPDDQQPAAAVSNNKSHMQSLTSISSEISSLHTTSHPCTDDDYQDVDDDDDDDDDSESEYTSSSSEEEEDLPPRDNFDYIYKGGYAMQVSDGKETKGVVPKTVKHVLVDPTVKSIEEGAFQGCNMLVSITIPSSIEAVGDHAFRKCSKLKHVTFLTRKPSNGKSRRRRGGDRGKTSWDRLGKRSLHQDDDDDEKKEERQRHSLYRRCASAPSSITEPRSSKLRSIGEWAFFNCSSLMAVTLPYGLVHIGTRAFQRCSSMSITQLPKTVTSVGENAFVGCPRETKAAYERWEKMEQSK